MKTNETINLVYETLKNNNYDMSKIEITKKEGSAFVTIKDYAINNLYQGVSDVTSINLYNGYIKVTHIKPNYLYGETITLEMKGC